MYLSHTNNGEHRLTMTSIRSNIRVSFTLSKAFLAGLFIMGSAMTTAIVSLSYKKKTPVLAS